MTDFTNFGHRALQWFIEFPTNIANWYFILGILAVYIIYKMTYSFLKTIIFLVILFFIGIWLTKSGTIPRSSFFDLINIALGIWNYIVQLFNLSFLEVHL